MFKQTGKLLWWGLSANALRTLLLLISIVGSLMAFSATEAATREMANQSAAVWQQIPYDISVFDAPVLDLQEQIASLSGVRWTEQTYISNVDIGVSSEAIAVPTENGRLLPLSLVQGRMPAQPDEVAISEGTATYEQLKIGDEVSIYLSGAEISGKYRICGLTNSPTRSMGAMTKDGLSRLLPDLASAAQLLVDADGTVPLASLKSAILALPKDPQNAGLGVRIPQEEAQHTLVGMALQLSRVISLVMLGASALAFQVLLALSQKERLYDIGVLRALGFSRRRMFFQLLLEGAALVSIGGLVAVILLSSFVKLAGLGNWQTFWDQNQQPIKLLLMLNLAATLLTSVATIRRSVTTMIRDSR